MSKEIFHIGYIKCGSTSIQQNLFSPSPFLNFAPRAILEELRSKSLDDLQGLQGSLEELRGRWSPTSRASIFSHEGALVYGVAPEVLLSQVKEISPMGEILIFVRPQWEIMRSLYDMFPVSKLDDRYSGTILPLQEVVDDWISGVDGLADRLKFYHPISVAQEMFGESRVHVFTFSGVFQRDNEIERLANVLGADRSFVDQSLAKRPSNHFSEHILRRRFRRILGPVRGSWFVPRSFLVALNTTFGRLAPVKRTEMSPELVKVIKMYYAEDNEKVGELVPELGYSLGLGVPGNQE